MLVVSVAENDTYLELVSDDEMLVVSVLVNVDVANERFSVEEISVLSDALIVTVMLEVSEELISVVSVADLSICPLIDRLEESLESIWVVSVPGKLTSFAEFSLEEISVESVLVNATVANDEVSLEDIRVVSFALLATVAKALISLEDIRVVSFADLATVEKALLSLDDTSVVSEALSAE